MLRDYNIQMGGGTLKIITFEKVNVSTVMQTSLLTIQGSFLKASPFVWLKTTTFFKAFRYSWSSW